MGLKAVAIYRDGCKASQPLNTKKKEDRKEGSARSVAEVAAEVPARAQDRPPSFIFKHGDEPIPARRRRLPQKRGGFTQEARVGGHKVFLRTGEYEDGSLGEIFIDMHKAGSALRSMINCFAISVSKGLQYGVPLEEFVDTFIFTRFEPQGMVDHPNIKMATSVIDFVFRVLGLEYLGRTDFCQVPPTELQSLPSTAMESSLDILQKSQIGEAAPGTNGTYHHDPVYKGEDSILADGIDSATPETSGEQSRRQQEHRRASATSTLDQLMEGMMGDAPFCESCGCVTVRNGACYRCDNCGTSMGCS
jgi:ribonucleoside-diphosphate reductase alpha chain